MLPRRFLFALDLLILCAAFAIAYVVAPSVQLWAFSTLPADKLSLSVGTYGLRPARMLLSIFVTMVPTTILFVDLFGLYEPPVRLSRARVLFGSIAAPLAALSVITLGLFAIRSESWSRVFVFCFAGATGVLLAAERSMLRAYLLSRLRSGAYAKNVVVVAPGKALHWIAEHIAEEVEPHEYALLGYLRIGQAESDAGDLPCLGDVASLGDLLINRPIHDVVVVQSPAVLDALPNIIESCDYFRVTLRIVPEGLLTPQTRDLQILYRNDALRLPAVVLVPPHLDSEAMLVKRMIDIVVSAVGLILLSPLFLLIAIAIKLENRRLSVFYKWRVIGMKGRGFTGYKFTTMVEDADDRRKELLANNEMSGPVFKIKDDPRVTKVGRFLRKFSLNELPQLWSVLKGDMSLVGPRPAFPHELEGYGFWHKRKLAIRPGITCLWQVSGRNKISNFDDWVKMDLEYIDNWSLWLDFKILVRTAWAVVAGTGS